MSSRTKSMDELALEAKALWDSGRHQSALVSAIMAASNGASVEQCPFGGERYAKLAGEWMNYFRIKAETRNRERAGERPVWNQRKPRAAAQADAPKAVTQTVPAQQPKTQTPITTSAAYAEQMGWETREELV
jgi:hypothetical protein